MEFWRLRLNKAVMELRTAAAKSKADLGKAAGTAGDRSEKHLNW